MNDYPAGEDRKTLAFVFSDLGGLRGYLPWGTCDPPYTIASHRKKGEKHEYHQVMHIGFYLRKCFLR